MMNPHLAYDKRASSCLYIFYLCLHSVRYFFVLGKIVVTDIYDVFTPNDTPTFTYVDRSDLQLEKKLSDGLRLKNMVISISGPSKTGKTVLVNKIVDYNLVIPIVGSGLKESRELWDRVLQWMSVPSSYTESVSESQEVGANANVSGSGGLPTVATVSGAAGLSTKNVDSKSKTNNFDYGGLPRVIKEISNSDFIIFIDDFHYINQDLQKEIGKDIKIAAEKGVKILTASVPHKSEDVVRSNPELRGRVFSIDIGKWNKEHLNQIVEKGFNALNVKIDDSTKEKVVSESLNSPRLAQTICLNLGRNMGIDVKKDKFEEITVPADKLTNSLLDTTQFTNFSKLLTSLHSGPKTRGSERKLYDFHDGGKGDVYRTILLAIQKNPISSFFSYHDITDRIRSICINDFPSGSSITQCLEQMKIISEQVQPSHQVIDWDGDILTIVDPYFLFFLRCSEKMHSLGVSNS